MRRTFCAVIAIQCIFINFCLSELSSEKKDEFVNCFIVSLNNLPNQVYNYEEGVLLDAQKTDDNTYKITARFKASEIHNVDVVKTLKCTGTIVENDNVPVVQQGHICNEEDTSVPAQDDGNTESSLEDVTTESTTDHGGPVKLYNEVQSDAEVTSGEQFVAIPRASPSSPCIGCASHVDPTAAGVTELAKLGIRHLDLHDPDAKHVLKTVVDVERQVQVVNGVRYILTLLVDYNNCTAAHVEPCPITTPCKVSILEKPWKKLPDGSKYRALIANNCTADWLFGDEGEVLPVAENNESNEIQPDAGDGDGIKVVHNFDVEARPKHDKIITEENMKNIEEQIIPYSEFETLEHHATVTSTEKVIPSPDNAETEQKTEQVRNYNENAAVVQLPDIKGTISLSKDKKKAIDDMMHYFDFVGFDKQEGIANNQRNKRSYDDVIKLTAFAKKVQKNNKVINNRSYMQRLAQAMVNHLNIADLVVQNRVLTEVLAAGEEFENNHRFFYLQALITLPCNKQQCSAKDDLEEICNGVIETSDEQSPKILNAFCYEVDSSLNKGENVIVEDPILLELAQQALKKIESEAPKDNAMKLVKILDATTYTSSGTLTKISMSLAYTDCKKSVNFYDRMNCSIIEDLGHNICKVEMYKKSGDINMQIGYECTERRVIESVPDYEQLMKKTGNFNDPNVHKMVEEAIRSLETESDRNEKQKLVAIKSVSTELVAGLLTKLAFIVGYTNCQNDKLVDVNSCNVLQSLPLRNCVAEVWDRPWLKDSRQIYVKCKNYDTILFEIEENEIKELRKKRSSKSTLLGGQKEQNVDDQKYKKLAQESLDKYRATLVGGELNVKELKVTKVTTQVVAGLITRIDFDVYPTNGDVITCHSKVFEQKWLNKKEITVNCDVNKQLTKEKLSIRGGQKEQNVDDQKYKKLAEESLDKYRATLAGGELNVKELKVNKVTTQVVAGLITRIDFDVYPTDGDVIKCHSKICERVWLDEKEISVNCGLNKQLTREKRSLPGGETEQNVDDQKYKKLAEESLDKYRATLAGGELNVKELKVTKVTTQVVAGEITRIDFDVYPTDGDVIKCHSKICERVWLNEKEISVNCGLNKQLTREKRSLPGGETEKNVDDQKYKKLAEESLEKYRATLAGGELNVKELKVTKVTTQVVAGEITRIDFDVYPTDGDVIKCHSKIFERVWLNEKEISVNCGLNKQLTREKRSLPGGETEKNVDDRKYKKLAEESLEKYRATLAGGELNVKELKVTKVTTQVVAGEITRIDFDVYPTDGDVIKCHSKICERIWLNEKEISVNCGLNKQLTREKRSLPGGKTEQNVDDQKYKKLAQESLDKYRATLVGGELNVKELKVTKVTTQVVAGLITRIDFDVYPTNGDVIKCHSKVSEQAWLNKKEITVKCGLNNQQFRKKREILNGNPKKYERGFHKEDATKPEFKLLANESLQKYIRIQNTSSHHEVVEVKHVKSQVVAGKLYEIDFTAAPSDSQNYTVLNCHAQVWSRPWLKSNEIDVSCSTDKGADNNENSHFQTKGDGAEGNNEEVLRPQEEIHDEDKFALAQKVLHYYERRSNSKFKHRIISVGNPYKQITGNIITMIEFQISPTQCLILDKMNAAECKLRKPEVVLLCKSIVRERPWIYFKDIKVTCNDVTAKKSNTADWDDETPGVKTNLISRERRNVIGEESDNYMDDDMKFYYADRAVQQINQNVDTHNLHKLITIHSVDVSTQMGVRMVRMYIETAMTFCVRHQIDRVDLSQCDEMEGLPHKLCHVRLWPSPNDEMVIRHVVVVCNDDSEFSSVAGFDIAKLISASLRKLESSPSIKYKLVHQGEPYVMPALSSRYPIKMNFVVLRTNCTKDIDVFKDRDVCFIDSTSPAVSCESRIYISPNSKDIKDIQAWCTDTRRPKRDVNLIPANMTNEDATISKLVEESLEKLETSSLHSYKQRILKINSYTTKITRGRETRIDFDVGYTSCFKYESVKNLSNCEFLSNLPKRHCISRVYETLWVENGKNIEVVCKDDDTPLESQMEHENADTANQIANEALKHIEAKYPNPKKLRVVRIFSLQKQAVAGIHYRMKLEIGITDCPALSPKTDCKPVQSNERNKFCRVNVWIKPWSDHPPNYRVTCDYQEGETSELYHRMQAEHLFAHFVATYKPDYMNDHKEMAKRLKVFRANVRKVHELNIHEKGTARYAMTRFSDLTYEEFSIKYLGLKPSLRNENDIPMAKAEIPKLELPRTFDWREHGAVTEVKNQGSCGSCWAFSVTGNIEGQWKLHSGKLVSLSEQELVDCDKKDQGCNGGLMDNAYRAVEELGGLETESDYPYEGEDDKCVFNHTLSRVQISGAVNISTNETEMAQWLVASGPISIGINANAMQFYVGGISHPWKMLCSPKNLDHGVLIVGFGIKDYPLFNKHLPYWIVKNSWGPSWGEQGYYRVYRGDGTCGLNQMASSAIV